jgi:hypothetical protein
MEDTLTLSVCVKKKDMDRILDIGTMPNREVKGTALEKEYDAIQKAFGYAAVEAYRTTGPMPQKERESEGLS